MSEQMLCPLDKTPLVMSERQNIEIDYCPTCRGVWLDRGELDKIIERSGDGAPQPSPAPRPRDASPAPFGGHDTHGYGNHKKRRKNFLEELFD